MMWMLDKLLEVVVGGGEAVKLGRLVLGVRGIEGRVCCGSVECTGWICCV